MFALSSGTLAPADEPQETANARSLDKSLTAVARCIASLVAVEISVSTANETLHLTREAWFSRLMHLWESRPKELVQYIFFVIHLAEFFS